MNYVFFIGGSGARAYKAFLHLCAAGVIKANLVKAALLDADTQNAACKESCDLFRLYCRKRAMLNAARFSTSAFYCDVRMYGDAAVISPIHEDIKHLGDVDGGNDVRRRAMKWFYTEAEREQDLTNGFYAHPNMGRIFFQNIGRVPAIEDCLDEMISDLRNDEEVRVAIVGSVFGGTGAAGIPSIFNIIQDRCKRESVPTDMLHICGILISPYFRVAEAKAGTAGIHIDSGNFYGNTKAALSYYRVVDQFEKTYLIGQNELELINTEYADGGAAQNNKPHIVEVFAAMAVKHFLEGPADNAKWLGKIVDRRNPQAKITWDDFDPDIYMWMDMLRTQAVLAAEIYPHVLDHEKGIKRTYQWYKVYHVNSGDGQIALENMRDYTAAFWTWMYGLTHKYEGSFQVPQPDGEIALCDVNVVAGLRAYSAPEAREDGTKAYSSNKRTWKERQEAFCRLVDTAQKIEFVADKLIVILSILGVVPGMNPGLGCADLFIKLFGLTAHWKALNAS